MPASAKLYQIPKILAHKGGSRVQTVQPNTQATVVYTPQTALMQLTSDMVWEAHRLMRTLGFVDVTPHMPLIVGVSGACENVDTLYKVTPSPTKAGHSYLAQSGQLYLEVHTNNFPGGRVYCMIPSSRAELEVDTRHLNQFPLWELEMNGNLDLLLDTIEKTVKTMIKAALASPVADQLIPNLHRAELLEQAMYNKYWPRVRYEDAVATLQANGFAVGFGDDLKAPHEAYLAGLYGPHFLTHFPLPIKFFNMRQNQDDSRLVNSADLILPRAGEAAGAAEREHEYERIVTRLKNSPMYRQLIELGGSDEDFAWYLDAHKGKNIPLHSGTGIGLTRVTQYILDTIDIHNTIVYPVDAKTVF